MTSTSRSLLTLTVSILLAPELLALDVVYVADTTDDRVYRMQDLNSDGDFDDAGEVATFYDSAFGALPMSSPNGLIVRPDGTVLVCESDLDKVLAFLDLNQDGDAHDAGEARVLFDGTAGGNAAGIEMIAANGLTLDGAGRVWVASSNQILSGTIFGNDAILRLEDLNADGDSNDAGEARVFHAPALGTGVVGDSIPTAVKVGLDGAVYYAENGVTGVLAKAIWRLVDLDASGVIDQPGEAMPFFVVPTGASNIFLWDVEQGSDGAWYVSDRGNEILWRAIDANVNGMIDSGEFTPWFTGTAPSDLWTVRFASDGSILGCEAADPDRIRRFADTNGNGIIRAGETADLYTDSLAAFNISNPRSIALASADGLPCASCTPLCFGDGTGSACPCGNSGAPGRGCANSVVAAGAGLSAIGVPSITSDTLVLVGSGMPNSSALYFQGSTDVGGGLGVAFGDGLRCAGGSIIRLGTQVNAAGTSRYPEAGDLPVSIRGSNSSGMTRVYQTWYRNAAAFCTSGTFNLTNAVSLTWAP